MRIFGEVIVHRAAISFLVARVVAERMTPRIGGSNSFWPPGGRSARFPGAFNVFVSSMRVVIAHPPSAVDQLCTAPIHAGHVGVNCVDENFNKFSGVPLILEVRIV